MKNKTKVSLVKKLTFYLSLLAVFSFGIFTSINNGEGAYIEASLFNVNGNFESSLEVNGKVSETKKLIPLGTVFGIKLYTEAVLVTGFEKISTENGTFSPARDAGLKVGDYIIEADGKKIENNKSLSEFIKTTSKSKITLLIKRNEEYFETEIQLIEKDGFKMAGIWIKDSAAGIGTLTYYDPETKTFAGLGHGICDIDSGNIMTLKDGEPENITITSIEKAQKGFPGRLCGYFTEDIKLGTLTKNLETGIYGTLNEAPENSETYETAKMDEITEGKAYIICTIDNSGPQKYNIEIEEIYKDSSRKTKNMVIKITIFLVCLEESL